MENNLTWYDPEIESGSASMTVTLSEGRVTVANAEDGTVLFCQLVRAGTWGAIWDAIRIGSLPYWDRNE